MRVGLVTLDRPEVRALSKVVPRESLDHVDLVPVVDERLPAGGEHEVVRQEQPVLVVRLG